MSSSVWIDTGGTFTDGLASDSDGRLRRVKVLSTSALRGTVTDHASPAEVTVREDWSAPPDFVRGFSFRILGAERTAGTVVGFDPSRGVLKLAEPLRERIPPETPFEVVSPEEAPLLAARLLTRTPPGEPLRLPSMRLGTTLGTNALLERRGVPTALFITEGFADLLLIGTQQRPELFALDIHKPDPLYCRVVEVPERLAADGTLLRPLDRDTVARAARQVVRDGITVAAVALLHSYRNPEHERALVEILHHAGFEHVSASSALAPSIKLFPRAQTTVVDAYLAPVVRAYLERVGKSLGRARLHVMTSAGGLVSPRSFSPKDSLLSGPAGGVVGAALAGRWSGFERILAFDMGGTSTDVARIDGDYEYQFEHRVGDVQLMAPALAIESVAAGGGSICWFDGQRLRVGPRSAGASPGPACYGAGGPLTLTDVNLLLGRLDPERFRIPIRPERSSERLAQLQREVEEQMGEPVEAELLLEGLEEIANETMADAIRRVSLRKGYDPADYALVAFGGAGGQHACGVAARLGVNTVVVPADAGLLSALGLGHARLERFAERQVLALLDEARPLLPEWLRELERQAVEAVASEGVSRESIEVRRRIAHLRFAGQDSTLEVECGEGVNLREAFESRHQQLFGHRPEGRSIELESLRVIASSTAVATPDPPEPAPARPLKATRKLRARFGGDWREVPALERRHLEPGTTLAGPALIFEPYSTTVVPPGWRGEVDAHGAMKLRAGPRDDTARGGRQPEAVRLELFTHRFRTIAREMGERLRRTAVSTNVKERMDFSCALLDADGELVVNAPHIPVHLGAIGLCVRRMIESVPMEPGDAIVTNHPAYGGSHLPDVTVVTPVHATAEGSRPADLLGYVASRAHHAEIGGVRPGSMPPAATRLAEEGVVIPPLHLVRGGEPDWSAIRDLLAGAGHPTRALEDNLADLRAAVAANHAGARALQDLASAHGVDVVRRYMGRLKRMAERRIREALERIPDGRYRATERLDDGTPLQVSVELEGDRATIDFAGTAATHPGNLNATPAIVHSAVIYVLRLLIREPLPLNEGLLRAVTIRIPNGILNPRFPEDPDRAPAVGGGNVETSQRLVDTLLKALKLAACSQGTMNNVIFGNERSGYYETVCGGCGAGPGFDGASAVHSHMTNTRITDPEILEQRYPVRVERFAIRRGSGGAGRHRGGDGAVRELSFLQPMSLSVLTQHRTVAPYGLEGGAPGAPGAQRVIRADGRTVELASIDGCDVGPGDRLVVETPGGGGYGRPE